MLPAWPKVWRSHFLAIAGNDGRYVRRAIPVDWRTILPNSRKVIITCAVTGSIHTPSMSPHLPITASEIAEAAIGAAEAGAAIVHLHARKPETGEPDQSLEAFRPFLGVIKQRVDCVLNITTGGAATMTIEERLAFLQKAMSEGVLISEKLTGLAGVLPDGVWLEMISYHNALDSAGQGQPSLTLNGACFLPNRNELEVISQFAQRVKQDQKFLRGFGSTQLGQIAQMTDGQDQTAFRTFQLNCRAERTTF